MRTKGILVLFFCLLFPLLYPAKSTAATNVVDGIDAVRRVYEDIGAATKNWTTKAAEIAIKILGSVFLIAFFMGLKDLVIGNQLTWESFLSLMVRFFFITGISVWLLKNPSYLIAIPQSLQKIGERIGQISLDYGEILITGVTVTDGLIGYAEAISVFTTSVLKVSLLLVAFLMNTLFFMIAANVLCAQIESVFILVGGMFTVGFFVVGHFRDLFMGYIKALAAVGVKLLLYALVVGLIDKISRNWTAVILETLTSGTGIYQLLSSLLSALVVFYMIIRTVPQYAASIMTGSASAHGGQLAAAALSAYGAGRTVYRGTREAVTTTYEAGKSVKNAAQAYSATSQAIRETGGGSAKAAAVGAKEAVKAAFARNTASAQRGTESAVQNIHKNAAQNANTLSAPSNTSGIGTAGTPSVSTGNAADVTIADSKASSTSAPASTSASAVSGTGSSASEGNPTSNANARGVGADYAKALQQSAQSTVQASASQGSSAPGTSLNPKTGSATVDDLAARHAREMRKIDKGRR